MGHENWDDEILCWKILNLKDGRKDKGGEGDKKETARKGSFLLVSTSVVEVIEINQTYLSWLSETLALLLTALKVSLIPNACVFMC